MVDKRHIEQIEEQAALHALGIMPPEEARQFEQRLAAGCSLCTVLAREFGQTASMLVLSAPEVAPPPGLRARLLEKISAPVAAGPPTQQKMGDGLIVRGDNTGWEPSPVPGVQFRHLYGDSTLIVRMEPGTTFPSHPHHSAEQCLVLEGSITSSGVTAYAGDFTYMPAGTTHGELYSETGCVLLIAYA